MTIGVQLVVLVLVRVALLNLLVREAIDVSRVELVHLLALDDFVAEVSDGLAGGQATTTSRGPDLYQNIGRSVSVSPSKGSDPQLTVSLRSEAFSPALTRSCSSSARLLTIKSRSLSAYSSPAGERSESAL